MRAGLGLAIVVALLALPSSASAIAITGGPTDPTNMTSSTFTFALEELETPYASYQCQIDAGTPVACASPYTVTVPAAGAHTFTVTGNNDPLTAAHHTWTIDLTPPVASIAAGPSGETTARSATFDLASNELGSTFLCAVDSTTLSPCQDPVTFTGLSIANHTFRLATVDPAGNQSPTISRTWTIVADNVPPETTITSAPPALNNLAEPAVSFTINEPGTFQCSVNGAAFAPCASPAILSALVDGAITFQVRAVDLAENIDPTPATAEWTRDTAPPAPPALLIARRARAARKATGITAVFNTTTQLRATWDRAADATASEAEFRSTSAGTDPELVPWTRLQTAADATQADVVIGTGRTGCVRTRSIDVAGNPSAWTIRCTTVPFKASSATVIRPFRALASRRYFAGQYVRYSGSSRTRGHLRLRLTPTGTGADVKRVWLVATTCPRCGAVRIVVTGDGTPPVKQGDIVASRTLSLRSRRTRRSRVLSAIRFDDALPSLERRYVYVFAAGGGGDRRIEGIGVSSL